MKSTPINEWLAELGSRNPTPGGGAVSALNGAIASAQLKMVCEYTKDEDINSRSSFLNDKIGAFLNLADADSEAFSVVSEAYKTKDGSVIDESLARAASVSIEIVKNCEELIDFCQANLEKFNKRLKADLIVVLVNLNAAVESARAMEETNLDSMQGSSSDIAAAVKKADELLQVSESLVEKVKEDL